MTLVERLKAITSQMSTLETESRSAETSVSRLAEINDSMDKLIEERSTVEAEIRKANEKAFQEAGPAVTIPGTDTRAVQAEQEAEQRVRTLRQNRAITIAALDTLTTHHQAGDINPTFNQVSNLVDLVTKKAFHGGETYSQAFVKDYGEAGYTAEGAAYTTAEPTWGYAEIAKTKITAYTEVSEEFEKLKPQYYLAEIYRNLGISIQKKLAKEIIIGNANSGNLTGILAPAAKVVALDTDKDLEIDKIDENTLNEIILSFGGDEDVYRGVLILNKTILRSFLKVRGSDKKPVYKVDFVNRTIDGVPYVINSHIKDHDTATAGQYTLVYGTLGHYYLVSFSPIEVAKSTDFKFSTGQVAYRASGMFGGNVTAHNAFLRVKKAAAGGGA